VLLQALQDILDSHQPIRTETAFINATVFAVISRWSEELPLA
jgi:hypothetical protein